MLSKLLLQVLNVVVVVEPGWSKFWLSHLAVLVLVGIGELEASAAGSSVVLVVRLAKEVQALARNV